MLSLSAAHLTATSPSQLKTSALAYRGLAISGLNSAHSKPPTCKEDADAILATCWILSAVTMYMGESVEEFFIMIRGIALILQQKWAEKYGTSFNKLSLEGQTGIILPRLEKVPLLPEHLVVEARESVELLMELEMDMGDVERRIYGIQKNMVRLPSVSSCQGSPPCLQRLSLANTTSLSQIQRDSRCCHSPPMRGISSLH
jgi:hypothetical protein